MCKKSTQLMSVKIVFLKKERKNFEISHVSFQNGDKRFHYRFSSLASPERNFDTEIV